MVSYPSLQEIVVLVRNVTFIVFVSSGHRSPAQAIADRLSTFVVSGWLVPGKKCVPAFPFGNSFSSCLLLYFSDLISKIIEVLLPMRQTRSTFLQTLTAFALCFSLGVLSGCKTADTTPTTTDAGKTTPAAGAETPTAPTATQDTSGDEILVGHFASLTGETATFGTETDEGIKLAIKQLNAKGGVLGKKFSLETQDDQSKAEEAKTVVTKFAADPKIVAVLGEVASKRSLAAAPTLDKAGIPMISPSSTNENVTKVGPYIFRVCFIDNFQGYVMAKFAADDLKAKKVAILRNQSEDYSVGLADVFKKEFTKLGGTITVDVSYSGSDSDFRSQLGQVKGADALFVPGYYNDVGTIARQARQLGIKVPLLGCDGWDSPDLIKGAGGPGGALEGSYFSNHYSKDDASPRVQDFVKAYEAEYKKKPSGLAALGYDAMMILADAITRANSTERAKVKDALAQTKDFKGVTGDITIDSNRNASKPAVVLEIKGDEFAYKTTVKPTT
jgi:branched-chain amino acid transport system substrate-binding protein